MCCEQGESVQRIMDRRGRASQKVETMREGAALKEERGRGENRSKGRKEDGRGVYRG